MPTISCLHVAGIIYHGFGRLEHVLASGSGTPRYSFSGCTSSQAISGRRPPATRIEKAPTTTTAVSQDSVHNRNTTLHSQTASLAQTCPIPAFRSASQGVRAAFVFLASRTMCWAWAAERRQSHSLTQCNSKTHNQKPDKAASPTYLKT